MLAYRINILCCDNLLQPSHIKDATLLEKKSRNLKEQLTVTNMKVISPFY